MKSLLALVTIGLTGCLLTVNSRQPFYTDATRISLPGVIGGWIDCGSLTNRQAESEAGDMGWVSKGAKPMEYRATSGSNDVITWVFFKANGNLYCDWQANDHDAYHHLYQADLAGNQLQLSELNGDWLTNAIARNQVKVSAPEHLPNSHWVFNATAVQWLSFLESLGTNTAAFSKDKICLTRRYNFVPTGR